MTPKLPPLPEPDDLGDNYYGTPTKGFTAEAMNARYLKGYNDALAAIKAQGVPDGWRVEVVSDGDIRMYGPRKLFRGVSETWLIPSVEDGFHGFLHRFFTAMLASAPPAPQVKPDRTGMTYYKNNACKAPSADHPDCICWTPAPQANGYGPKLMPQVSGYEEQPDTIAVSSTKQAAIESAACAERDARIAELEDRSHRLYSIVRECQQRKAELERQLAEARNQALEDAAKCCDDLAELNRESPTDSMWEQEECAAAIRAMKKEQQ